jgi:hypothetical protein
MANKEYFVGEIIKADGDEYKIIGKITYRNKQDGKTWDEYKLLALHFGNEIRWLSVDNFYKEYSLSRENPSASTIGYHLVDTGYEQVIAAMGDVDVQVGDEAAFQEYEDPTEEKIVSLEKWDDGDEYSSGYYLDPWEFGKEGENTRSEGFHKAGGFELVKLIGFILVFILGFGYSFIQGFFSSHKKIDAFLKKNPRFTYVTSITGMDKQKANVYECTGVSLYSPEEANMQVAKTIIDGVNGNTSDIQQNDEKDDNSVAILTPKEYALIYRGEDDKVYVQVSNRKYAYTTDKEPYRSRERTHRYYRRFYYSRGYYYDRNSFTRSTSSYDGFTDGQIEYNSSNDLNTYSGSVRQESISSRSSDGGGLSSGK